MNLLAIKHIVFLLATAAHIVLGYNVACNADSQVYSLDIIAQPCYNGMFKSLVFFGDSWTENGDGPLNSSSYALSNFGGRQTNGPTWAEYLAKMMGADLEDYAFSGATANNSVVPRSVPDTGEQIALYQQSASRPAASPSLHFIWTGVNDIHDIFVATTNETERYAKIEEVINSLRNQMDQLFRGSSVRYFVIMGLAPIDRLPLFQDLSFAEKLSLVNLIAAYNSRLRSLSPRFLENKTMTISYEVMGQLRVASQMSDDTEDIKILFFDVHELFRENILANASSLGIVDIVDACKSNISACNMFQQRYLWWDDWHPTTYAHQLIASAVSNTLAS